MMNERQKNDYREASTPELLDYFAWLIAKSKTILKKQKLSSEEKDEFKLDVRCALRTLSYLEDERKLTSKEVEKLEVLKQSFKDCLRKESGSVVELSTMVGWALCLIGCRRLMTHYDLGVSSLYVIDPEELEKVLGLNLDVLKKEKLKFCVAVSGTDKWISLCIVDIFELEQNPQYEYLVSKVINNINRESLFTTLGSYTCDKEHLYYKYSSFVWSDFFVDDFKDNIQQLSKEFIYHDAEAYYKIKRAANGILDKMELDHILKNLAQIVLDYDNHT